MAILRLVAFVLFLLAGLVFARVIGSWTLATGLAFVAFGLACWVVASVPLTLPGLTGREPT